MGILLDYFEFMRQHESTFCAGIIEEYYPDWTGKPDLTYHKEIGDPPHIWHLSSEIFEARVTAAVAHDAIQEKKTVLILAPKKEFFPLLLKELKKKQVPHSCSIDLLPSRVGVAKRFIDWVQNPNDSFRTRLVLEDLMNMGVAAVPGAAKDGRSSESTIERRIAEEKNIANLWNEVDKGHSLCSVIEGYDNDVKILEKMRDGLVRIKESYSDYRRDNRGEFAKQLAFTTGIWIEPSKMAEDIACHFGKAA